jgi:pimeloyl-ACP methyl ester carboxylesterase
VSFPETFSTRRIIAKSIALALSAALSAGCFNSTSVQRGYLERQRNYLGEPLRPVIVVPGFGVSQLYDERANEYVWGPAKTMMRPALDSRLVLAPDGSTSLSPREPRNPRGPINSAWRIRDALRRYGRWSDRSEAGAPTVYTFAYDFRLSFGVNARELHRFIERLREERAEPAVKFDLVGHSAGALVIATYLAIGDAGLEHESRWPEGAARARNQVEKAVLLAVPARGTPEAFRFLTSGDRIVRRSFSPDTAATFPSVFEMLPAKEFAIDAAGNPLDLDSVEVWKTRKLSIWRSGTPDASRELSFAQLLAGRARLQRALAGLQTQGNVETIAGDCIPTADRLVVRDDGTYAIYPSELRDGEERSASFVPGDGSVTAPSATALDPTPSLVCIGHQGLVSDPDAIRAILRALLPSASLPPSQAQ